MVKILEKKIVVNARFLTQKMTGVQRFAYEICRELKKSNLDVVFYCPANIELKNEFDELNAEIVGSYKGHIWEQIELPLILFKRYKGSCLLLNLCNLAPLFSFNKIMTLHDIAFKEFPNSFSFKFRFLYSLIIPLLLKKSKLILTVSEFSKENISKYYNIDKEKISVVYNAVSDVFKTKALAKKEGGYILAVSSLNKQKNFELALSAMEYINDKSIKLKVVGGYEKSFQKTNFKISKNVEFLGRVEDSELLYLYKNAEAFISPSLYEGFGIPLLEAQSCRCPIIVSDIEIYREVCSSSAIYFDPFSPEDLASKINNLLSDGDLKDLMIKLGVENSKRFSWSSSTQKINALLKGII